MGLSVGPQSFAPVIAEDEVRAADGQPLEQRNESPLDPLIAALGRAVERSARHKDSRKGRV